MLKAENESFRERRLANENQAAQRKIDTSSPMELASHGELFPLQLPAVELAARIDLYRGTRQRINHRRAPNISVSEAVLALERRVWQM